MILPFLAKWVKILNFNIKFVLKLIFNLIILVDFLLLIETIQGYTKHEIDRGLTPLNVYTICSCIRESFCLSYSIRKENNLLLFSYEKLHLIKFQGDKLRFLGSDERSQALLLNKALQLVNQQNISERWTKSTPGIFVRKFENMPKFITFITQNYRNHLFILNDYIKGDISLDYIKLNDLKDLNLIR